MAKGRKNMSEENSDVSGDVLPDDLDITKYVGPYQFPTPRRRRTAAYGIFAVAIATLLLGLQSNNTVLMGAAVASTVLGIIFFVTAWPLNVSDVQALTLAAKNAPFSVGHASAQLSFSGWFSKPTWRVVVFSSEEPPTDRGLVEINAVSKEIISTYFDKEESKTDA